VSRQYATQTRYPEIVVASSPHSCAIGESSAGAEHFVARAELEQSLAGIAARCSHPLAGIFGPDSISWKINRESALFLGAGRAAILQLAHPWVATALEHHSNLLADPIARFHNTFRIVLTMNFGTLEQALAAARHLYARHAGIRGQMSEEIAAYRRGSRYEANEISALRWVFATLVESAVLAFEAVMPPLSEAERAAYYDETKTLAGLFGLPAAALPEEWSDFEAYIAEMTRSSALGVTQVARSMAHSILAGSGSWIDPPEWYCALTATWLPERFRAEFGLRFGETEQRRAERALRVLPRVYRWLPAMLRFIGPWHEAVARLAGGRVGWIAELSNRFWIGEPHMPFADVNE